MSQLNQDPSMLFQRWQRWNKVKRVIIKSSHDHYSPLFRYIKTKYMYSTSDFWVFVCFTPAGYRGQKGERGQMGLGIPGAPGPTGPPGTGFFYL